MKTTGAMKNNKGRGLLNYIINKMPMEMHLPSYQFCGPGTKLKKRLARGDAGINSLDRACRVHDMAYDASNVKSDRHAADSVLEKQAWDSFASENTGLKEKAAALAVATGMKLKRKLGMGYKKVKNIKRKTKKTPTTNTMIAAKNKTNKNKKHLMSRIIPTPKYGGVLPLITLFSALSALGGLAGGISNVIKTAHELKTNKKQGNGIKRYRVGRGMYLKPYKGGGNSGEGKKKNLIKKIELPDNAMYDYEVIKYAKLLKIPHFRGCYCRDNLPKRSRHAESMVVNLDSVNNSGTHWVCFSKIGKNVNYFDSYGNLKPPVEIINYLKGCNIYYNYDNYQNYNSSNCAQLCLRFLASP
ncbi:uncharacterized protein LOC126906708 [Daktulosphaira vitifoliae]|uniref:uncharacterized protein LOC126906708 n=1 Tax=Daktulosphaira vitifoliae TaxID=58002 RepID=UPI0021AA5BD4|nr:uncharacterized protein LOC126906708 [Daktulosphaira vitifoliae]